MSNNNNIVGNVAMKYQLDKNKTFFQNNQGFPPRGYTYSFSQRSTVELAPGGSFSMRLVNPPPGRANLP